MAHPEPNDVVESTHFDVKAPHEFFGFQFKWVAVPQSRHVVGCGHNDCCWRAHLFLEYFDERLHRVRISYIQLSCKEFVSWETVQALLNAITSDVISPDDTLLVSDKGIDACRSDA